MSSSSPLYFRFFMKNLYADNGSICYLNIKQLGIIPALDLEVGQSFTGMPVIPVKTQWSPSVCRDLKIQCHAIPYDAMPYHAILHDTMQWHAISWFNLLSKYQTIRNYSCTRGWTKFYWDTSDPRETQWSPSVCRDLKIQKVLGPVCSRRSCEEDASEMRVHLFAAG